MGPSSPQNRNNPHENGLVIATCLPITNGRSTILCIDLPGNEIESLIHRFGPLAS
jgi:hypothetical protein